MTEKNRDWAVETIRVIAIFAVVLIHTTTKSLETVNLHVDVLPWSLGLNQIARFAVPIFFLVSGFALESSASRISDWKEYFVKRFKKIVIPYFVWSGFYYFLIYTNHQESFWGALIHGSAAYQLYFIPSILILYLIFPLIHSGKRWITNNWVMGILGIFQLYLLDNDYNLRHLAVDYPVIVAVMNFWVFCLGIKLAGRQEQILRTVNKYVLILAGLTTAAGGYVVWQGYTRYLQTYNFQMFYSSWRPSVLIYTLGVFGVMYYFFNHWKVNQRLVGQLAKLSFTVFFVHVLVLEWVWKLAKLLPVKQLWFDPLLFAVVTVISFGLSYLIYYIIDGVSKYAKRV